MLVYCYRNLRKKCWSVKALEGENKGRVISHEQVVALRDVEFRVSEAGRQRVLREKRKNVHAGAVGYLIPISDIPISDDEVSYDPYRGPKFYRRDNWHEVSTADEVLLTGNGKVRALNAS